MNEKTMINILRTHVMTGLLFYQICRQLCLYSMNQPDSDENIINFFIYNAAEQNSTYIIFTLGFSHQINE